MARYKNSLMKASLGGELDDAPDLRWKQLPGRLFYGGDGNTDATPDFSEADPDQPPSVTNALANRAALSEASSQEALKAALEDKAAARRIGMGKASPMDYFKTAARVPGQIVRGLGSAALSGATLPGDVAAGKQRLMDPATGDVDSESIQRSLDLTGLVGSATLAAPRGALGAGAVLPKKLTESPAPPFYSAAERAIAANTTKVAPAEQWLATLKNTPGVRGEELEYSGLGKFLESRQGQPVTRDEIAQHLDQNQVKVQEVTKGAGPSVTWQNNNMINRLTDEVRAEHPDWSPGDVERETVARFEEEMEEAENHPDQTKFSEYQLPGGENYREVLFTLPPRPGIGGLPEGYTLSQEGPNRFSYRGHGVSSQIFPTREEAVAYAQRTASNMGNAATFQSSHWDEPNVLVHARVNDRMLPASGESLDFPELTTSQERRDRITPLEQERDRVLARAKETEEGYKSGKLLASTYSSSDFKDRAAGIQKIIDKIESDQSKLDTGRTNSGKTLFLEELQSDWHQQGRKYGYQGLKERFATNDEIAQGQAVTAQDGSLVVRDHKNAVPDAPFKKTWPDLVLKRMVREAAEKGYDQVAWTDGATQADRYDLSKKVDGINVKPEGDGKHVVINAKTGVHASGLVDKSGKVVQGYDAFRDAVGKPLSDLVGKDVADKIMAVTNETTLSGLDLRVGGEGMKGFYDKILPATAEKLFKKWGGKVEKQQLPVNQKSNPNAYRLVGPDGELWAEGDELAANRWRATEVPQHGARIEQTAVGDRDGASPSVHVLKITPELRREALTNGFPLFSGGKDASVPGLAALSSDSRNMEFLQKLKSQDRAYVLKEELPDVVEVSKYLNRNFPLPAGWDPGTFYHGSDRQFQSFVPEPEAWGFETVSPGQPVIVKAKSDLPADVLRLRNELENKKNEASSKRFNRESILGNRFTKDSGVLFWGREPKLRKQYQKMLENDPIWAKHNSIVMGINDKLSKIPEVPKNQASPHFFFQGHKEASTWGKYVYPVRLRMENPYVIDWEKEAFDELNMMDALHQAVEEGHDSVIIKHMRDYDRSGEVLRPPRNQYIVLNPNQIRSLWAQFDPGKRDEAGLLLSGGVPLPDSQSDSPYPQVDRTHDVPAFAGSSNDGKTVYIDRHVPASVEINGKPVDLAKYLAMHETTEHRLMTEHGLPYAEAHKLATQAERGLLESDGVDWKSYEAHVNGMLRTIEHEPIQSAPDDLYLKPYHAHGWGNEAKKLERAENHERHLDPRPLPVVKSGVRHIPVDHDPFQEGK